MAMDRPENWNRLTLRNIDRQVFIKEFLKVRDIRNKIMHLTVSGLSDDKTTTLKKFVKLLRTLDVLRSGSQKKNS
jgi:hypothetical protein